MYTYTMMATGENTPTTVTTTRSSVDSNNSDQHGFTQDWVDNHSSRVGQRQIEVHDVPHGAPRSQIHQEEEESKKKSLLD